MTVRQMNIREFEEWATLEIELHRYVGEIVLEPEELCGLCKMLGRELGRIRSHGFSYRSSLTVAAVNCAYYYLDAEGFWTHFLKLLRLGDVPTDPIGSIMESCLLRTRKLAEERFGGWRYVGPVIEQCGVTTNYLNSYGLFLKSLEQGFGWEKILAFDYSRYRTMVPPFGTRYLTRFLKEKEGWEFTYNVVRALHQYFRGYVSLDELKQQKGFHKSFWDGIFPILADTLPKQEAFSSKIPTEQHVSRPVLVFLPEQKSLAIRLDAKLVDRGCYTFGETTCSSRLILVGHGKIPLRSDYRIDLQGEPCYLQGWDPGVVPFAFFHCVNGLVGNPRQMRYGTYYLIASREFRGHNTNYSLTH